MPNVTSPRAWRAPAIAGVTLLLLGATAPPAPRDGLPTALRAQIDREYHGWRFADVDPWLRKQLAADQRPGWVRGDFDGDGGTDYAVQIVWPAAPRDSNQLLLAYLRRPRRYLRLPVRAGSEDHAIYLGTGRRGKRVPDLDGDTDVVYRADAIELFYGQEAGEACLYLGGRFRCVAAGD